MLYLLTLGWPWFAGAAALGLIVGAATRPPDAAFKAKIGFVVFGAAMLGLLGAALLSEKFQGREALILEFALLAGAAYSLGVLSGGAFKIGGSAPASARFKSRAATAPILQFHDGGKLRRAERPSAPSSPVEPGPTKGEASVALEPSGEKPLPGKPPEALAAPRAAGADDLKKIKGVGPKSEAKLNALGIYHFDQIAEWSLDNARWIGAALATPGRIERGKWIQQAQELAAHQQQSPTE
jgi:predicted flap endonuclease-1-like 5' DNA nuclease